MNIGIVTIWGPTGAGNVSRAYEKTLSAEHSVYIYARGGPCLRNNAVWGRSNVTWAPPHPCTTGIHRRHFIKWIKRNNINIIIFNEQRHWCAVIWARNSGIKVGAYIDYYTAETVPFFKLYDFLICNTQRHYGVFRSHRQCVYCPWGTNVELFAPKKERPVHPVTFLISAGWDGRYVKDGAAWMDRRGAELAMRVFSHVEGDCRLIVLSQIPLNECITSWQKMVNSDYRIQFIEGTFEPTPYTKGNVYLYPSRLDGIGLTLPEALCCGLPAITTNSPPMNEFVDDLNGCLVKVKEYHGRPDGYYWAESIVDEVALVAAMQSYVSQPGKISQQSTVARRRAEESLNWDKNSSFLAEWIVRQQIESDFCEDEYHLLLRRIKLYDALNNPTPLQWGVRGGIHFVKQCLRRCGIEIIK